MEHKQHERTVCVVVLGDIGRSPRMEYHASSLLQQNINVNLIGYLETKPIPELLNMENTKCNLYGLKQLPDLHYLPTILKLLLKTIWQAMNLLMILLTIRRPNVLLVQNPPGIPTLIVCYFYCKIIRSKFIIDWHNYTYTILAMGVRHGQQSLLCRLAKWLEYYFGRKADDNFCVTKAMQQDLHNKWHINNVTVLYDRPPLQFQPIDIKEKHRIFLKLSKEYPQFVSFEKAEVVEKENNTFGGPPIECTRLTYKLQNNQVFYTRERVAILVSSTSWTPDEDFSILLKALQEYEKTATSKETGMDFPFLLCIITGKGPEKNNYLKKIAEFKWKKIAIITPWLDVEDYPKVLASADLGVSLHYSSSGLDLPMKVIDMFGCNLPVCAYNFDCLNELIQHNENSFVFDNSQQLADQLKFWFKNFPNGHKMQVAIQKKFRKNLREYQTLRWHNNWLQEAWPIFNKYLS